MPLLLYEKDPDIGYLRGEAEGYRETTRDIERIDSVGSIAP
jgi:hypothetical protein